MFYKIIGMAGIDVIIKIVLLFELYSYVYIYIYLFDRLFCSGPSVGMVAREEEVEFC